MGISVGFLFDLRIGKKQNRKIKSGKIWQNRETRVKFRKKEKQTNISSYQGLTPSPKRLTALQNAGS